MAGLSDILKFLDGPEKLSLPPNNLPVASKAKRAVHPKKLVFFCAILRRFCDFFFRTFGNPLGDP
jgi:hypothetical protein